MKLIVGLGNPGSRYSKTRHNTGRRVVESLAETRRMAFRAAKALEAKVCEFLWEGEETVLAYPELYMNLSGQAVGKLLRHFRIDIRQNFLVLVDDMALELAQLRLRAQGSDGGHKGLRSIQGEIGSSAYARLRIGIGAHPESEPAEAYVLADFPRREEKILEAGIEQALEACRLWLTLPISKAMSAVNTFKIKS